MPIEKVIDRPSAASRSRGLRSMPSLERREHYLASEHEREQAELLDVDGQQQTIDQAVQRLGGVHAEYHELVSAASLLESKCLAARHPDRTEAEVMGKHFAAQARELDPTGRASVAVHQAANGSWHAHIDLPGREVPGLRGPHGLAIRAWDRAWDQGKALPPPSDFAALAEAKRLRSEIATLRQEIKASRKEEKARLGATQDAAQRNALRAKYGERTAALEAKLHDLQTRRLEAFYGARGCAGSLEHQVELEREEYRHRGEERKIQQAELGQRIRLARQIPDQERFCELGAAERLPIRAAALARELEIVAQKHDFEAGGMAPDSPELAELRERQSAENTSILLRFEVSKLRDRETDLSRQGGVATNWANQLRDQVGAHRRYSKKTLSRWATTYEGRKVLMAERHSLEGQVLQKGAEGSGRAAPTETQLRKLHQRQARERKDLEMEPGKLGLNRAKGAAKSLGKRAIRMSAQAMRKLQEAVKKAQGQSRTRGLEDAERGVEAAQGTGLAAASGTAKVVVTVATETTKAAVHQAQHAAKACAVTAEAITAGIINPAAGAKIAAEGYAEAGKGAAKDATNDAISGAKATSRDAATAARQTGAEMISGLTSFGMGAAPPELQHAAKTLKEAGLATVRTAKNLLTMDFLGASASAGEGALATTRETAGMLRGKLPMPFEKIADLASKIPVIGLGAKALKLTTELAAGAAKAKAGLEIDR